MTANELWTNTTWTSWTEKSALPTEIGVSPIFSRCLWLTKTALLLYVQEEKRRKRIWCVRSGPFRVGQVVGALASEAGERRFDFR